MELKLTLCQLLLKYDWRLIPGQSPVPDFEMLTGNLTSPDAVVEFQATQKFEGLVA